MWASYVASLFLRTQKVRAQISAAMVEKFRDQSRRPSFLRDLQYELLKEGRLVYEKDLRRETEQLRASMESSPSFYHLSGLPQHTVSLAGVLAAKTWRVLQAAPSKFFVLSDCPVSTIEITPTQAFPGPGFAKENCAVILPLTPTHMFVASSSRITWSAIGSEMATASTNRLTVRFASKKVYAHLNSPEIKNLVDFEIDQIRFGKNAFVPEGDGDS